MRAAKGLKGMRRQRTGLVEFDIAGRELGGLLISRFGK